MKTIVICGGGRRAGKTTLADALARILPDAKAVKIGEHPPKGDKNPLYFKIGEVGMDEVRRAVGDCEQLVIESGAVLDDPSFRPDLVIFLPSREGPDKPGSERRRARAHLIRGETPTPELLDELRARLQLDDPTFAEVLKAAGIPC